MMKPLIILGSRHQSGPVPVSQPINLVCDSPILMYNEGTQPGLIDWMEGI